MPAASLPRSLAVIVLAVVATIALSLGTASPVSAAFPRIAMMLTATPHYASGTVTYTGTIYPVSGTATNVRVHMELSSGTLPGGTCEPVANCEFVAFRPNWTFPSISSTKVITFDTTVQDQRYLYLWLDSEGTSCYGVCPARIYLPISTVTAGLSWSTPGQVMTGSTLHITARASTDSWWEPFAVDNEIALPAGVDAPTNLPPDATYSPEYHVIDRAVAVDPSDEYSFDVVVNASSGSTLTFTSFLSGLHVNQGSLTIKVGEDHTAPTTTIPKRSLVSGPALSGGQVPVKLAWTGNDSGSGIEHYTLAQSTDGHAWTTVGTGLTSTSVLRSLSSAHAYRFRVRAIDHAGNVGAWAYGSTFTLSSASETSSTLHYGGTWALRTSSAYRGGHAKAASTTGKSVSRTFTGTSFAWLATKGPTQGMAQVSVNGTVVATVDLYALTSQAQRLVWTRNYTTSRSRTVTIKILGTPGRPGVNLDGIFVIR